MIEELFTIERNLWNQLMVRCAKIRTSISLESLINLMYLPKDASSLGVIRFLYGKSIGLYCPRWLIFRFSNFLMDDLFLKVY